MGLPEMGGTTVEGEPTLQGGRQWNSRPPQWSRAPWVFLSIERSCLLPIVLNTFRLLTKSGGFKMDLKKSVRGTV